MQFAIFEKLVSENPKQNDRAHHGKVKTGWDTEQVNEIL
jgi:hypothetical protein